MNTQPTGEFDRIRIWYDEQTEQDLAKRGLPFKAQNEEEREVSGIVRMMIQYWTLRTMIERARQDGLPVNPLWASYAKNVRVQGFRAEFNSKITLAPGQSLFDEERARQAGTRIAYLLLTGTANFAVGEGDRALEILNQAFAVEEDIVTIEVNRALYGIDLEQLSIAA